MNYIFNANARFRQLWKTLQGDQTFQDTKFFI